LVDDDRDMRFILKLLLERAGYQVKEAADGVAALQVIHLSLPDLLLTDLRMPRMDGSALIQHLRTHEPTAELPIILISAYAVLPETAGLADAVIPKPFAPERAVEAVARLLGGRRATDGPIESNQG
jgi:CheY-like chemotaxis protein